MQQFLVTVQADLAGHYALPPATYRHVCTDAGTAASRAWKEYKQQPRVKRRRLDNIVLRIKRA